MWSGRKDAYGRELMDYLDDPTVVEIVERDDGYIDAGLGPATYFAQFDAWADFEQQAMGYVRGRVLDVGPGAGRHALYLQGHGHDVVGIDNSRLVLEVCRRRGVADVRLCPLARVSRALGVFGTVLMMGNNFGLMESRERAPRVFRRLARITSPDARIIAMSTNPYGTSNPDHLVYHQRNLARGRMAGQVRIRVRRQACRTPWFDYLLVSVPEMETLAAETPWRIATVLGHPDTGPYIAVLEKRAGD